VDRPLKKHPEIDQVGDTKLVLQELANRDQSSDRRLQTFLGSEAEGLVQTRQNALIGHSAGALALQHGGLSDLAKVVIPMAGDGTATRSHDSRLVSTLILGAADDSEVAHLT
jgi:hypothetical protein